MRPLRRSSQGFTLIELMIASLLGSMMIGAMLNFYLTHHRTHQHQMALSHLQENARFLHLYFSDLFHTYGKSACPTPPNSTHSTLLGRGEPWAFDRFPLGISVHRYDPQKSEWQPALEQSSRLSVVLSSVDPQSDILIVRSGSEERVWAESGSIQPIPHGEPFATLSPEIASFFNITKPTGALYIWSDCHQQRSVFSLCHRSGTARQRQVHFSGGEGCSPVNDLDGEEFQSLLKSFETRAGEVRHLESRVYYLNRKQELVESFFNGEGEYDTQPLMRGLSDFRLTLLERDDSEQRDRSQADPAHSHSPRYIYRTASEVVNWGRVSALTLHYQLIEESTSPPLVQKISQTVAIPLLSGGDL
jgi:prepilin-type N-terminal cleavage/methylation domain-containing protein